VTRHSLRRPAAVLALAALSLSLAAALTGSLAAPAPAGKRSSPKPPAAKAGATSAATDVTKHPKFRGWINSVPDTGQFLPDSVWLLQVGPRVTRVADFVERWFGAYPEFRPPPDSLGRVKFLQNLINKDVLGLTALALDRPLGFEDRLALREARERALSQAVYQRFVHDSVRVSDDEIRALWETYKWNQHLRHIVLPDRNAAASVRRELVAGRVSWSAAVKKYSLAGAGSTPDGDLGWVDRRKMDRAIANVAFALHPGQISEPVQDAEGWHLVQSVDRKPAVPPLFEALRRGFREDIFSAKASVYVQRMLAMLRVEAGVRYDTANAVFASQTFRATRKVGMSGRTPSIEIDAGEPEFSNADTARTLATWSGGGRYSLGDLVHSYSAVQPLVRPSLNAPDALIAFVETTILSPKLAEYGARHGLEHDPLVEKAISKKREELLVEHLYQDSISARVWVSKEERKAYYQKNRNGFVTYPSVDFAAIARASRAGADSVERALRSGVSARAILAADSAAGLVSGSIQFRSQAEQGPYHQELFEEMRPGDIHVRGPDKSGDYVIIQLLSFDPGRQLSFEEAETVIDESLQNLKSDEALQSLVERLKKRYEIRWRPELVTLVRLAQSTPQD